MFYDYISMETLQRIIIAVIILISVLVVNRITAFIIKRIAKKSERMKVLSSTIRNILKYFVWLVGIMVFCGVVLKIDSRTIWATLGVGSLALTLALQNLLKDIVMGVLILIEGTYKIGDRVTIKALGGTVQMIGIRTTKLQDDDGAIHIINNSEITIVTNYSKGENKWTTKHSGTRLRTFWRKR